MLLIGLIAVLGTAGCQDELSPLESKAPQIREGGLSLAAANQYEYVHTGDIGIFRADGALPPTDGHLHVAKGKNAGVAVIMSGGAATDQESMVFFSDAFADQLDPDGVCFPRDASGAQTMPVSFAGTSGTSGTASAGDPVEGSYFFQANDLNGATGVKYILRWSGTVISGTFPPEVGDSATISHDAATMEVEAKGKGKSQSVCVGPMSIGATVEFTGIN
ncbi:MAG TPA: hypothetical protein VFP76_05640 [Gemmatimonadota bacterium]|nr:hypothetical protein [Gemmatimonadota bacterium]